MHSSVRSNLSAMDRLNPRAWLMVHLAVDLVSREDHHAADRVGDRHERLVLRLGELFDDRLQRCATS